MFIRSRLFMLRISLVVLISMGMALNACGELADRNVKMEQENVELIELVEAYVSKTKGWPRDDYHIQFDRNEGEVIVFLVVHAEDESSMIPGGGKSVEVYVNSDKLEVIKELGFQ